MPTRKEGALTSGGTASRWSVILAGVLVIGLSGTTTASYVAPQLRDAAAFVVMIGALTVRPQGLFGKGLPA